MPEFCPLTLLINVLGIVWFVGTAIYIGVRVLMLCNEDNKVYVKKTDAMSAKDMCSFTLLLNDDYIRFVANYMHWYKFVDSTFTVILNELNTIIGPKVSTNNNNYRMNPITE